MNFSANRSSITAISRSQRRLLRNT